MKKCPSCQRTFEDTLRFCQNDGTALIDEVPVDPFKTMIAGQPIEQQHEPIEPPQPFGDDDPLQIPDFDPNKTSVYSATDQSDVLSTPDPFASLPEPEPFSPPPAPDIFSTPPLSQPDYQPIPPPPSFAEPEQSYQPAPSPFDSPFSSAPPTQQMSGAPDWNPPPAPAPQWENQGSFGSNTPFQPPGASQGENKTLAIIAMICGILSIPCCWLSLILGPAAAIMGFIAKNKADSDPMNYGGRGMAMAGLILGIVGTVIWFGLLILNVIFGIMSNVGRF
jgi:hypothetical protein